MAYTVSLAISLAALVLFNRVTPEEPLGFAISQTLVLAFLAAVGGAAGRLWRDGMTGRAERRD